MVFAKSRVELIEWILGRGVDRIDEFIMDLRKIKRNLSSLNH